MKIAFLEFTGQGGIHQYSARYVEELTKIGFPSILITSKNSEISLKYGKKYEVEPYSGVVKSLFNIKKGLKKISKSRKGNIENNTVSRSSLNHNSLRGVRYLWEKIIKILQKEKINILHIQWLWDYYLEQLFYLKKIRDMGIKIIFTFHNWAPHNGINEEVINFYEKIDPYINLFFTHSHYDKEMIEKNYKISENKIKIIQMGNVLEFDSFDKIRNPYLTLLFFGYIRPYKGLEEFLTFFEENNFPFHLKIFGNTEINNKKNIQSLIENNRKFNKISANLSYIPNAKIPEVFKDADFLILPYKEATQSALISLAYSLKTPVIVYDVGGLSQNVKNNETGFIVQTPFEENFTKLMQKDLISIREKLSQNVLEYYESNMKWEIILKKYKKLLDLKF